MKKKNRFENDIKEFRLKKISQEYIKGKQKTKTEYYDVEYRIKKRWYFMLLLFTLYVSCFTALMSCVYDVDFCLAFFEFSDHYLFIGGATLVVYLVFKRKK